MILTSFNSRSPRPLDHVQHRSFPGRGFFIQAPDNDGQFVIVQSICGGATDASHKIPLQGIAKLFDVDSKRCCARQSGGHFERVVGPQMETI
jgi:hypothetical protein